MEEPPVLESGGSGESLTLDAATDFPLPDDSAATEGTTPAADEDEHGDEGTRPAPPPLRWRWWDGEGSAAPPPLGCRCGEGRALPLWWRWCDGEAIARGLSTMEVMQAVPSGGCECGCMTELGAVEMGW